MRLEEMSARSPPVQKQKTLKRVTTKNTRAKTKSTRAKTKNTRSKTKNTRAKTKNMRATTTNTRATTTNVPDALGLSREPSAFKKATYQVGQTVSVFFECKWFEGKVEAYDHEVHLTLTLTPKTLTLTLTGNGMIPYLHPRGGRWDPERRFAEVLRRRPTLIGWLDQM